MTLNTHAGGGMPPAGTTGPGGMLLIFAENHWSQQARAVAIDLRRSIRSPPQAQLIFTEQRVAWVPQTLADLDSIYFYKSEYPRPGEVPKRILGIQLLPGWEFHGALRGIYEASDWYRESDVG